MVLDIRESTQGGMYGEGGNVFCPHTGIAFVVKSAAEACSLSPIQPTLLQSPVYEDKNGDVAAAMQMSHFMSKTIALRRAFFFFFFFFGRLSTHGLGLRAPQLLHHTAQKWTLQISVGGQPWQRSQREEKQPVL